MASDLECFRATTEHRRPERVLFYASFVPDLQQRVIEHIGTEDYETHYGMLRPIHVDYKKPDHLQPPDFSRYWEHENLPEGTTITHIGAAQVPSGYYHFFGYISPLRNATSLAELEDYPLPDFSQYDDSHFASTVTDAHDQGRVTKAWIGHMYEDAWQIRGLEEFLEDMIERPDWAECLLEKLFQRNMSRAIGFARAKVDWIVTGDDVANQHAMMFAPHTWRDMMLSRWRKVWQRIKEISPTTQIWYHSDGNIEAIVPDLIDAGVDILNPIQPECLDVPAVYRMCKGKVTFDGLMGTQSTMPFGTPDDVRTRVKDIIDTYGQSGGLIISPTHVLEPEVPLENIDAFCNACREYGSLQ